MILQSLVQYYEILEKRGDVLRPGWCKAKISFALDISGDGELLGVIPLKKPEQRGKKSVEVPQNLDVPEMVPRSSGVLSNFLCDNSSYLLGIDKKGKPERSLECFEHAKEKHIQILKNVSSDSAAAVRRYFEKWDPGKVGENPILKPYLDDILAGGNLIFSINDVYAQDDEDIQNAWNVYLEESEKGAEGICLVTGKRMEIARIHGTIKGVPGAQSSGAALVSFNAPAFESFGKEQSFNAPVSTYAVYAYTTALNYLLADKKHATSIGDTMIVYWSEDGKEVCQNVFAAVSEPTIDNQEIVDGIFKNLASGKAINIGEAEENISMDQRFYILGLSPNAARIAVRFFYQDSFGNILKNLQEHYKRMEIVKTAVDGTQYLGIWRMLQETVNKKSRDKKPSANMAGAVYRAVVSGSRYPDSVYQAVMGRIRADQDNKDLHIYKVTRGRAAIIKAYLLRNKSPEEGEVTVALNENSTNIAYTLGRIFAVLEKIQKDANPEINATIKDRYFNSASATPATIFPILFKLKNSHIKKISSKGKEIYYETMLGELQDKIVVEDGSVINAYPRRLSLEEQGLFVLGYYHQTQKLYEKKEKEEA